jgi:hypothetical protein
LLIISVICIVTSYISEMSTYYYDVLSFGQQPNLLSVMKLEYCNNSFTNDIIL